VRIAFVNQLVWNKGQQIAEAGRKYESFIAQFSLPKNRRKKIPVKTGSGSSYP
jgi:hypothetical protein